MLLSYYQFIQDGNELLTLCVEGILCGKPADGMVNRNASMPEDLRVPLCIPD